MLWLVTLLLLFLWIVGLVGFPALSGMVHLLLAFAVIAFILQLVSDRRAI